MRLRCGRFDLCLDRPRIMGVLNLTPDSFHAASRHARIDAALAHARTLIHEGADLLDIGAESTRPGAEPVTAEEEWRRLAPVLEALRGLPVPLSVDTRRAVTMRRALDAGVDMINDVGGFADPDAVAVVAASPVALCVMHMAGEPATMQHAPRYRDVLDEVARWLGARVRELMAAGVAADRLVLDPGIGFGKHRDHNLALLRDLRGLAARAAPGERGLPMLVGLSRKSLIGDLTGRAVEQRLAGSLGGALAAVARGAAILRVHDVAATRDALTVWSAIADDHPLLESAPA
jgi:dihydropteroate synthase